MTSEAPRRILDSDTHVIENRDTWTSRLPSAWGDEVMHMVYDEKEGREVWRVGDSNVAKGWAFCFYGSKGETYQDRCSPRMQQDVHPACYDAHERAKLMDSWGVAAAVLYPNATGFSLEPFLTHPDPKISIAHVAAYNDFLLEEWVAAEPGRFVPIACVPYWDVPATVAEIERIAGKGFGGITTTGAPQLHDQPYLGDRQWDPMWAAASAAGLPIAFHVGNGDISAHFREGEDHESAEARQATGIYLDNAMQMTDLLLSGVPGRFADLKFIFSESGMGWVPFVLASLDERFKRKKTDRSQFGGLLPGELFRRQVHVNFFFERVEDWHIQHLGEDNLMFQTDVPHQTGFYADEDANFVDDALSFATTSLSDQYVEKVLWGNAARVHRAALEAQGVPL